jgi:hypothetical protein
MRPAIRAHGAWFVRRLAQIYETPWPSRPIDVDVAPVVPPYGASTIGEPPFEGEHAPLIIVSSSSAKRQGREIPPGLWHDVIFYTAGHLTRERLGPQYVPYAERPENHLFEGHAATTLDALAREWQPYLDGRTNLESAVDALVLAFPSKHEPR